MDQSRLDDHDTGATSRARGGWRPRRRRVRDHPTGSGSAVTHLVRGLGLGSHRPERQAFGMSSHNTITRLREHLTLLRSIFDTGAVDFSGKEISAQPGWPVQVAGGRARPGIRGRDGPKGIAGHLRAGRWHSAKSRRSSDHRRVHRTGRLEFGRRRRTAETQDHRTGARNPVRQR